MFKQRLTLNLDDHDLTGTMPTVGSWYRHFKGSYYKVIAIAFDADSNNPVVIYQGEAGGLIWSRPLMEWFVLVENSMGQMVSRFTLEETRADS